VFLQGQLEILDPGQTINQFLLSNNFVVKGHMVDSVCLGELIKEFSNQNQEDTSRMPVLR